MANGMYSEISGMKEGAVERLRGSFEEYATAQPNASSHTGEDTHRRERARLANKLYRKACLDFGLDKCFFTNFATWSDYVGGRMSESEFMEKALDEAERMKSAEAA